jgi:hypothetical protein
VECADRLGREASTVRTQISRALQRLRTRLDRRDGGRQAWMPALVVLGQPGDRIATTSLVLGTKSLGAGAVLAATVLWLGAAMPNGCGSTIETASADPPSQARPDDDDASAPATHASTGTPRNKASTRPFALGGPDPDDDDDVTKWGADPSQENAEGAVHPLLALTMAMRGMYDRTGRCHTSGGTASARVTISFRFDPDGSTAFERVDFTRVKNLDEDELECIRQTLSAREIQVRRVDVTMIGFDAEASVEHSRSADLTIAADGTVETSGVDEQPRSSIISKSDGPALAEALAQCGPGPVDIDAVFDPKTRALASATPMGEHADDAQGRCVAALVAKLTKPTHPYQPRVADDSRLHCTFGVEAEFGLYTCTQAGPPVTGTPRLVQ